MLDVVVLIVVLLAALSKQQTITLSPYDSPERNYQSGVDRVVYTSQLLNMDSVRRYSVVRFEKKTNSNDTYRSICYMQVNVCEQESDANCRCVFNSHLNRYELIVNISAEAKYSRGRIKGTLMYNGKHSYTEELVLPAIYDVPQIDPESGNLYINDREMSDTNCFVETDYDVATIVFTYTSQSISLELKEGNTTLKTGTIIVVYTMRTWNTKTLTLSHKDTVSNFVLRERICTIQKTLPEVQYIYEDKNSSMPIVVLILCSVETILLGILIIAKKNKITRHIRVCASKKRKEQREELREHTISLQACSQQVNC